MYFDDLRMWLIWPCRILNFKFWISNICFGFSSAPACRKQQYSTQINFSPPRWKISKLRVSDIQFFLHIFLSFSRWNRKQTFYWSKQVFLSVLDQSKLSSTAQLRKIREKNWGKQDWFWWFDVTKKRYVFLTIFSIGCPDARCACWAGKEW